MNQAIKLDDWVMVYGQRIGEFNFVGQVTAFVDADNDHDWYEVTEPESGFSIVCCCHLIEKVQKPSAPIMRSELYRRAA